MDEILDESVDEVDAILEDHFAQLLASESEKKRKAFHDYVSKQIIEKEKIQ